MEKLPRRRVNGKPSRHEVNRKPAFRGPRVRDPNCPYCGPWDIDEWLADLRNPSADRTARWLHHVARHPR
jgi:hypothetical protein